MAETTKSKIIIVDQNDKIIGHKNGDTLNKEDIYRVSALWITNSRGEILLARRHHTKSHHPRKWGPAVAGTVDEGETYEENIIKEAEEELGLKNIKPKLGLKTKIDNEYHHFTQWYVLCADMDIDQFKIQEEEVEEIEWYSSKELKKQLQEYPEEFLPTMKKYFELFLPCPCKKEFKKFSDSVGGILLNNKTGYIALVKMEDGKWGFPKGKPKDDETKLQTAQREIYEETGIKDFELVKELSSYQRPSADNPWELKTIYMYIFKTDEEELNPVESDIIDAKWVSKEEVLNKLTLLKDKEYFQKIYEI